MRNFSILFVLLFLCGCGGDGVQVRGTVSFDDGTPLTRGTVRFIGEKTQASGVIKENGTYVLGETKSGGGIKPGQYAVVVTATFGGGREPIINLVDLKFSRPDTSELTCEVTKKMTYAITVTKPPATSPAPVAKPPSAAPKPPPGVVPRIPAR